jgi:pimeloyl-ACP methyl ester carboxylesterase
MLRGRFYVHAGHPKPAVVMTHGFSATISGMVADLYAEMIHAAGVQVLLFDHRGFGLSAGDRRQEINRWVQARGYRDALDFLTGQPCVDHERIAIWGDSLSGAVAIGVAAFDPRVRALIVQVPACGARRAAGDPGGEGFEALRTIFDTADLTRLPASTIGPAPVVSPDQLRIPSLLTPITAFDWFQRFGTMPGTLWVNRATVVDNDTDPAYHAELCSPHLGCPSLWVVADDEMPGAATEVALAAYRAAPRPKELLEIEGGHFGLLYPGTETFERVADAQCRFIARHLVSQG